MGSDRPAPVPRSSTDPPRRWRDRRRRHLRYPPGMRAPALFASLLALSACATPRPADDREVRALAATMTGTFSSRAQHDRAPDDYFDIRLVMVPVWEHRADGPWLYVEQAMAARTDAPYRQRVYRLSREGDRFASEIYTLPGDPKSFAGAWREALPLGHLKPEDLTLRDGCTVHLRRTTDGGWEGGTVGDGCSSELRGAKHATTEIRLADGLLRAWDRGFAADGTQVWGPTAGAYEFVRTSRTAP